MSSGLCDLKGLSKVQRDLISNLSRSDGHIVREFQNGCPVFLDMRGRKIPESAVTGLLSRGLLIDSEDGLLSGMGQVLKLQKWNRA
jgi:hypothetical protein